MMFCGGKTQGMDFGGGVHLVGNEDFVLIGFDETLLDLVVFIVVTTV